MRKKCCQHSALRRAGIWQCAANIAGFVAAAMLCIAAGGCQRNSGGNSESAASTGTQQDLPAALDPAQLDGARTTAKPVAPPPTSNVRLRTTPGPGFDYVGPEKCGECHAARLAECQETGHFHTCRVPVAEEMSESFTPEKGTFVSRYQRLTFQMSREGDDYYQTAIVNTPTGPQRTKSRIDFVYGAGTADDVFLSWRDNGELVELPVVWLHPFDSWGISSINPGSGGDFSRPLTPRCLECHTTWFEYEQGTINQYSREHFIANVTCERCHGPGREHVTYHEEHPEADKGQHILHPGQLSRERQLDVCLQCHSNAIDFRQAPYTFRPGDDLNDFYRDVVSPFNEDDHVANQIRYLRQSKCFQQSEMTCITCHDPHRETSPTNAGSASCMKCHQAEHCTDRPNLPAAVQDDCAGCHMPKYVKINVNFHREDDRYVPPLFRYEHRIAVHERGRQDVLWRWYRTQDDEQSKQQAEQLQQTLVTYWMGEAEKRKDEHRYLAAVGAMREALRYHDTPELQEKLREYIEVQTQVDDDWFTATNLIATGRGAAAIPVLEKLLAVRPIDARVHGRLGTLYAQAGDRAKAIEHLEQVAQYDPDDAYGYAMLGWLALLDGKPEEALPLYHKADEVEPYNAKIHFHLGLVHTKLNQLDEAITYFRKVLEIEPQHMDAHLGLIKTLRQQGRPQDALPVAQHAVELTGEQNIDTLMNLAETYFEAGDAPHATETAMRARTLAQRHQPQIVPRIDERLNAYRGQPRQ